MDADCDDDENDYSDNDDDDCDDDEDDHSDNDDDGDDDNVDVESTKLLIVMLTGCIASFEEFQNCLSC